MKKLARADARIAFALTVFALFFRLATLMMIHTGVDERDYWFSAKAIAFGLPYPELTHRTVRFSVILPVAAAQLLLGEDPNVYYVLPAINSMLQAALAYLLGAKLRGRLTGLFAALGMILFPYMIRSASQVRPEVFSMTYILASLWCFLSYLEGGRRKAAALAGSALFLFAAYEAKITNLFFLPGMVAVMLLRKKPLREIAFFGGILLGLFLAETGLYAIFTDYPLGQLQVIARNHLEDNAALKEMGFLDLFRRYAEPYLQLYWQAAFALFVLAAAYYAARRGGARKAEDGPQRALIGAAAGFFLCITFAVKSVDPIVPAEPFINRYFSAVLGPLFLVIGSAVEDLVARRAPGLGRRIGGLRPAAIAAGLTAMSVAIVGVFSLGLLPSSAREYAHSMTRLAEHPLALNERYRAEADAAFRSGTPIVAVPGLAGTNALETCSSYYLSVGLLPEGRRPAAGPLTLGGAQLQAIGGTAEATEALAAVRDPFRLRRLPVPALPALTSESFRDGR